MHDDRLSLLLLHKRKEKHTRHNPHAWSYHVSACRTIWCEPSQCVYKIRREENSTCGKLYSHLQNFGDVFWIIEIVPVKKVRVQWGWTVLEIKISCSQWEGSPCTHEQSNFFSFREGKIGIFFLFFPFFPMCSHHVLNEFSNSKRVPKFPKCFQMHFSRYSQ